MPDAATINALGPGLGFIVLICYLGLQAWSGAKGKNSAYSPRDEKHDANVRAIEHVREEMTGLTVGVRQELSDLNRNSIGALMNVQTAIEASYRNHERLHNDGLARLEGDLTEVKRDVLACKVMLEGFVRR